MPIIPDRNIHHSSPSNQDNSGESDNELNLMQNSRFEP